jgi:ubiquinone/menaquinone biosynthesis C-methylase UbiE
MTEPEKAWEHYWQSPRLASCGGEGERQYQPAIVEHWHRVFAGFRSPPAILDLCCGNGALAIMACRFFSGGASGTPAIDAVDRARIDPVRWLDRHAEWVRRIRFRNGVSAESLPFPDGHFTAVISQYGIEYTDTRGALQECRRVLAPRGHLAFLCHAREGVTTAQATRQQTEIEALLTLDYFPLADRLLQAELGLIGTTETERARLKASFATLNRILRERQAVSVEPQMYESVGGVVRNTLSRIGQFPPATLRNKIAEVARTVEDHAQRTRELIRAARTDSEIRDWLSPLTAQDFRAVGPLPHPVHGPSGLLGWAVVLERMHGS